TSIGACRSFGAVRGMEFTLFVKYIICICHVKVWGCNPLADYPSYPNPLVESRNYFRSQHKRQRIRLNGAWVPVWFGQEVNHEHVRHPAEGAHSHDRRARRQVQKCPRMAGISYARSRPNREPTARAATSSRERAGPVRRITRSTGAPCWAR